MSEKPPRRKKKEESPESAPNPELERLISQAPKGSAPQAKQEIQPEHLGKRIVGGDDAWIKERLDKIDTLNFKPGFPPEELFNETPSTKEIVSDNPVDTVLAKITAEKKLFKADVPGILRAIGGKNASPEAIEKVTKLAAGKFSGTDYNYFLESVDSLYSLQDEKIRESTPNLNFIREKLEKLNDTQIPVAEEEVPVKDNGESQPLENISSEKDVKETAPEHLPGSSPEELKEFEENLRKSVEDWQEKRKKIESSESPEENMPAVVAEPPFVDANRESVPASKMITDASEPNLALPSEGAFFTRAQKEGLARDFGVDDAPTVSHEEASEGAFLTPEQKKYLSELDVPMPAEERGSRWKPTTRAEWKEELYSLIFGEKNSEGKRERIENLKANLAKRSEQLGEKAKEYGPVFVGYVGSKIEQYNKLKGWQKLAITGALMAGTAFSAGAPAIISTGFTAALWGQRLIGAIGMGMNKRKELDAKIAANPEHKFAGKSEWEKNKRATLYAAGYMLATSGAVYLGVEGLKAVADSEWLANMLEHHPAQSDISASGPETLTPGLTLTPEEVEALAPSTDALENLELIPDMPEAHPEPYNMLDPEVDEHIAKAHEAIDRMRKLVDEQAQILNTMPDGSETPGISSAEVPLDQVHTVQELDPTLFAEAKGNDQLRILAENSLKHLTPNEQAVLDNHIASLTPRERYFFDQYTNDLSSKLSAPEIPLYDPEVDEHIANVSGPDIPDTKEGLVQINPEPQAESGDMPALEQSVPETPLPPEASVDVPFGRDPIDGHTMSEIEAQKLTDLRNAMHDPRETGAWPPGPPEEKGFFEKLFGSSDENPTETAGQFNIDSVSATEPHIYADAEGHLFTYGGSIEDKINTIQKFLTENPDKIVYGTDDSGNYRIPWSLYEGHALPGEPVRTGGFFGFFLSSFMDAPKPEEFVKKIK